MNALSDLTNSATKPRTKRSHIETSVLCTWSHRPPWHRRAQFWWKLILSHGIYPSVITHFQLGNPLIMELFNGASGKFVHKWWILHWHGSFIGGYKKFMRDLMGFICFFWFTYVPWSSYMGSHTGSLVITPWNWPFFSSCCQWRYDHPRISGFI